MAIFAQCDCNDAGTLTLLSAHTACNSGAHTGGATWSKLAGSGDIRITAAGRLQPTASSPATYQFSPAPADADYTVSAQLYCGNDTGFAKLLGRQTASTTYYAAWYSAALDRWQIDKVVGGTTTQIGSTTALAALTAGRTYALQFDLQGSSLTLRVDGAVVAQATDSAITAAGHAGVAMQSSGTVSTETICHQIDSVSADDVVLGAGSGSGGGGGGGTVGSGSRAVATHRVRAVAHVRRVSGTVITPPTDTTPPVIVPGTILVTPTTTTLVVTWQTDKAATSVVRSGTTTAYGTTTTGTGGVTAHTATVTSLTAGTAYHLQISTVGTVSGLETVSDDIAVSTSAVVDTTPPVVSAVSSGTPGQSTATIAWTTDEASDSQVEYGETTAYGSATTLDATLVTGHSVGLTGLNGGTTYHYRVRSNDASGNLTVGTDHTLLTATPIPAPVISNVAVGTVTSKAATISGNADVAATVAILYGTVGGSLGSTSSSATIPAGGGPFSIQITGLSPSTTYYYQVRAVGAGGTTTTSQSSFATSAPAVQLSGMALIGVDTDTGVLGPYTDTNGQTTEPVRVTYNSIGVDLRFTRSAASDVVNDVPSAWARFKKSGEPDADWTIGSGGWRYHLSDADDSIKGRVPRMEEGADKAFVFSFLELDAGTTYDCEAHVTDGTETARIPFSATTWTDAIVAPGALAPTHYVNYLTGDDTRSAATAQSPATPWKTINKALSTAPSGAVVQVADGFYPILNSGTGGGIRSLPITLLGTSACVEDRDPTTRVIAAKTTPHAVICGSVAAAPTGSPTSDPWGVYPSANVAPWVPIQVTGPRNGLTYTIYRWSGTGLASVVSIGYAADRFGRFIRMTHLDSPGSYTAPTYDEPLLNTPGGFAEQIATSPTVQQSSILINGVLYMVWVRPEDPNSFWWEATANSRWGMILRAANCRVSRVHVRMALVGIEFGNNSADSSAVTDGIVDHCLTDINQVGIRCSGGGTTTVGYRNGGLSSRFTIQDNLQADAGFREADFTPRAWTIIWSFVKDYMLRDPAGFSYVGYPGLNHTDGLYHRQGRLGGFMESSAYTISNGVRQVVYRRNHVDGVFNGLTVITLGSTASRYQGENVDGTANLFTTVVDDCWEPERRHTNLRFWDNWCRQTVNPLSMAPCPWGPYYYWRNVSWDTGVMGMGQYRTPSYEAVASNFSADSSIDNRQDGGAVNNFAKIQPLSTGQQGMLYVVHNTHWTTRGNKPGTYGEELGTNGPNDSAVVDPSGMPIYQRHYFRNNIFRVTGYAARWGASFGQYHDEDYNVFVTSEATKGLRVNGGGSAGTPFGNTSGATYTGTTPGSNSIQAYRTLLAAQGSRPTRFANAAHTNKLGGSDIAFTGSTALAAVDALFTDTTTGDLTLKAGTNGAVDAGKAICNLSDRPGVTVNGSTPDLGALER